MHLSFRQCRCVFVVEDVIEDFVKKFVFTLGVLALGRGFVVFAFPDAEVTDPVAVPASSDFDDSAIDAATDAAAAAAGIEVVEVVFFVVGFEGAAIDGDSAGPFTMAANAASPSRFWVAAETT